MDSTVFRQFAFLVLLCSSAAGECVPKGDLYLDIHGASEHPESWAKTYQRAHPSENHEGEKAKDYNESNPGLGIRYEWGDPESLRKFITAGQYLNSFNRPSTYAGGGFLKRILGNDEYNANLGITAGGITGYTNGVTPAVFPTLSVGAKNARLNLMYAPETDQSPETYMLSASYKLSADKERADRIKEHMVNKE